MRQKKQQYSNRAQAVVEYVIIFAVIVAAVIIFIANAQTVFTNHFQQAVGSILS